MTKNQLNHQQDNDTFDLEQVSQFQPEVSPRSTSTANTDPNTASLQEARRFREQGDPNEYSICFEDQD